MSSGGQKDKVLHQMFVTVCIGLLIALLYLTGKSYSKWINQSDMFKVNRIDIQGNELLSREEILRLAGLNEDMSTWKIDLKKVEKSIRQNVFFEEVCVNRKLPDGLTIRIKEKRPIAILKVNDSLLYIDPEGLVLPSIPGKYYDLPILSGDFKGEVGVGYIAGGKLVQQGLYFLLTLLHDRPGMYNGISEVLVGEREGLILYTNRFGVQVKFGNEKFSQKIRCLEAILNELTHTNELYRTEYIDLNFNGQVVVGMRT